MASYPTTLKISCDGETRRVCRASVTSFDELKALLVSFWGEHNFVLQYKDDDGDLITVSSDSEFQESLSVASAAPVLRFAAFRSLKDLRTELHAAMAPAKSLPVHQNIVCDKSGMNPIVGPRYHVPGANYDLCEAEFTKLPEAERLLFVKIDSPGSHPVPCCEKTTEVPNPIALLLNSRRRRASCFRHHRPAEASEAAREYDAAAAGCAGLGQTSVSVDDLILQAAIADSMHALGYTDDDAEVATALASAQKRRWERGSLQDSQPQEGAAMELLTSFLGNEGILAARELAQVAAAAAASLAQTPRGSEGSKGTSGTSSAPEESCGSGLVELLGAVAAAHLGEGKGHGFKHHRKGCFGKGSGKGHGKGKGCGKGKGSFGRRGVGNADGEAVAVHHGISCDKSGMNPIVGTRYHVPGANFDLCEAEFAKLPEAERLLFVKIYHPGATPLACMAEKPVSASADGGGSSSLAAGGAGGGSGDDEVTDAPPAPKAAAAAVEAQAAAEAKAAAEARAAAEAKAAAEARAAAEAKAAAEAAAQAKAAEAKAVETSAATGEIKFQTQLAELAELGFYDRDANVVLLERYQGRMDRTLNALLDSSLN